MANQRQKSQSSNGKPPFNMSAWGSDRLREDARWKFGVPSAGNANYG